MVAIGNEKLLKMGEAAKLLGKHPKTIARWAIHGYRGVVLDTVQVGRERMTSMEALQRFSEATKPASARAAKPHKTNVKAKATERRGHLRSRGY